MNGEPNELKGGVSVQITFRGVASEAWCAKHGLTTCDAVEEFIEEAPISDILESLPFDEETVVE